jgi:hypothetical protein
VAVDNDLQLLDAVGAGGRGAHVRARLLAGAWRLPKHHVAATSLGEHELGAVVPGPVGDHVDRRAAPTARPKRHSFDDHRIVGPLVQPYRVGEQSFFPRPSPRRAKQQVTASERDGTCQPE